MDKKSLVLTIIFILIAAVSVAATFHRYIVVEDISYETDEPAFQAAFLEE